MIIKLLSWLFNKVIGNFPEEKKDYFWLRFNQLMAEVVKAGAEGAVKGYAK